MFDLVLLLVQLPGSKEVVDRLVILHGLIQRQYSRTTDYTYNFQELTLHSVLPTFLPHHLRDLEHLFHRTRYHTFCRLRNTTFHSEGFTGASLAICENADVISVDTALSELRDIFEDFRLS